jgi:outer membrane biosynthesis protein TonB
VFHKRFQPPFLRLTRPSVLGDGVPERLRSTLVALLGITGAAGLAMVALVLQQGFPLVSSGPVRVPRVERERLDERVAAKQAAAKPQRDATPARVVDTARSPVPLDPGGIAATDSPPSEAAPVLVTGSPPTEDEEPARKRSPAKSPPSPQPAVQAPPASPVEEPTATPSSEPPAPAPEPEPEPVAPSHPGNGNAYGKVNGNGNGKSGGPPGQAASAQAHANSGESAQAHANSEE